MNWALEYYSTSPCNVPINVPGSVHSLEFLERALLCTEDPVYSYPSPYGVLPTHLRSLATPLFPGSDLALTGTQRANTHIVCFSLCFLGHLYPTSFHSLEITSFFPDAYLL